MEFELNMRFSLSAPQVSSTLSINVCMKWCTQCCCNISSHGDEILSKGRLGFRTRYVLAVGDSSIMVMLRVSNCA